MYVSKNRTREVDRPYRKWTAKDNAKFRELYAVLTIVKVAEHFDITEQAAKMRAQYLGCRKEFCPGPAYAPAARAAPLAPLEFAPGHVAFDQKSYDLLKKARAIR